MAWLVEMLISKKGYTAMQETVAQYSDSDEKVLSTISQELGYTNFEFLAETYQSRVYYGY